MLDRVRLESVASDAAPPPAPAHYDARYELPKHRVKLLETRHGHPRDARIVFYEEPHIYTVDGAPVQASVSGLAAEFEEEFDGLAAIKMMKFSRKQRWPRLEYVVGARRLEEEEEVAAGGTLLVDEATGETVAACVPAVGVSELRARAMRVPAVGACYAFERAMRDDEILAKWAANGEDARNRGTEAHLQMELWFNSEAVRLEEGEVRVGLEFVRRCLLPLGAVAYRTEWTIFGEEENVAGCIDLAVKLPSGALLLVDWKRSEKLASKMRGYKRMRPPLDHLDDCSGCAYALQLGSYQYLIEKYYGMRVAGRALASIHPDKPFVTAVPYLDEEVEFLMARQRAVASTRRSLAASHPQLCCARTGRFVTQAVRLAGGELVDAKTAILAGVTERTADASTTREAQNVLASALPPVPPPASRVGWRERFPAPTEDLLAL